MRLELPNLQRIPEKVRSKEREMRRVSLLVEAAARAFETRWGAQRALAARVLEAVARVTARANDMAEVIREMERMAHDAGISFPARP